MQQHKHQDKEWNAVAAKKERIERLQEQKHNDGTKKPLRKKRNVGSIIAIVVLLLVIVGMLFWAMMQYGFIQRYQTAFTVDFKDEKGQEHSQKVSVAEANFYFGILLRGASQTGAFTDEADKLLDQPAPDQQASTTAHETAETSVSTTKATEEAKAEVTTTSTTTAPGRTMRDYLRDTIKEQAKSNAVILERVKQEEFKPEGNLDERFDQILDQMKQEASSQQISFNTYLSNNFGPGASEKSLRKFMLNSFTVQAYLDKHYKDLNYDEQKLEEIYKQDPTAYDSISYYSYYFADQSQQADQANADNKKEEQKADPKQQAEELNEAATSAEAFQEAVLKYVAEGDRDEYKAHNKSYIANGAKTTMPQEVADWLFASERQTGDHAAIKTSSGYYTVLYISRQRDEARPYSSRHILLNSSHEVGSKEDDEVKAKAEKLLDTFNKGDKSEDSFAKLAQENSEDPGSKDKGGLYENIEPGNFVAEYEDFCLDPARKAGDTDIIRSQFGYHIIYFKGLGEPQWKNSILSKLRTEDTQKWLTEQTDKAEVTEGSGYKSIGK